MVHAALAQKLGFAPDFIAIVVIVALILLHVEEDNLGRAKGRRDWIRILSMACRGSAKGGVQRECSKVHVVWR